MAGAYYGADRFPAIRSVMAEEYAELAPRRVAELVQRAFGPEAEPEDVEDFLGTLNRVGRGVTKAMPQILGGALQGAGTGAAFGPYGTLVGAGLGAVSGGPGAGQTPVSGTPAPAAGAGPPVSVAPQAPAAPLGLPMVQAPSGTPTVAAPPAALQLLQTLFQPQVIQALMAMALGPRGRQQVLVGNQPVPVAAFANLLGALATRAVAEYAASAAESGEALPEYLLDDAGVLLGDPSDPLQRAEVLLGLLGETSRESRTFAADRFPAWEAAAEADDTGEYSSTDWFYDALDLAELYGQLGDPDDYAWTEDL